MPFSQFRNRMERGFSSKLCICTSSSLTMPPVPWEILGEISNPLPGEWLSMARGLKFMPPRRVAMASISSMKPIAPPSIRATLRSWRKKVRILRAVMPYHIDWNDVDDTNRKGTPASLAIALARWVLPVPGGPSKSTPRRGLPPISVLKRLWLRKTSSVWRTSRFTGPRPTTLSKPTSICSGR